MMANPTIKLYHYKPMKSGGRTIRVLKLLAEEERCFEIQCQIERLNLDDNPIYEALSYPWGDANDRREI